MTLKRWRDIWLNEGFAEFSSWLWDEHTGGQTDRAAPATSCSPPASRHRSGTRRRPTPAAADEIFAGSVYDRGAGTLAALRRSSASRTFFKIMRGWLRAHRYGNATGRGSSPRTPQRVSHVHLAHFFRTVALRERQAVSV